MTSNYAQTDVVIIGAGPCGLFAVFELGLLDLKCHLIDILDRAGGQCAELYPEKPIYDIPAWPVIGAQELVDKLMEHIQPFGPEFHFGEMVAEIERTPEGFLVRTDASTAIACKVIVIAAGGGSFQPKRPPIPGIEQYEGTSVFYSVRRMEDFRGHDLLIVGGGDSALDWTLGLQDTATLPITLVHRRDRFRALETSVSAARRLEEEGKVRIVVPAEVRELRGNGSLQSVVVENTATCETEEFPCEALITLLGFHSHLGSIADWGLELHGKRQILVEPKTMETTLPGVYAAGDVAGYEGKITLITIGFGEAAIAANNAIARIRGEKVQPKYSTD